MTPDESSTIAGQPGRALAESHLDVEGCVNFRDAGGWTTTDGHRVRRGLLLRADDPIRLTASGRATVAALGLRLVVDVRQVSQWKRSPGFASASVTFHRPLVDRVLDPDNPPPMAEPVHLADLYERMIEIGRPFIAEAVDEMATSIGQGPVLVHCAFGKDRTGIIVAVIQAAIGMSPDDIAQEYGRSDEPSRERRRWMIADPLPDDPPIARSPEFLFTAPADAMAELLARAIDRHGSLEGWVQSFGLGDATIERLRAALLEG